MRKEPDDILLSYQHFPMAGTRDGGWIWSNWPINEAAKYSLASDMVTESLRYVQANETGTLNDSHS